MGEHNASHQEVLSRYMLHPPPPAPGFPAAPDILAPELTPDATELGQSPFNEDGNFVGDSPDDRDYKLKIEQAPAGGYEPDHVLEDGHLPNVIKRLRERSKDAKWAQVALPVSPEELDVLHAPTERERLDAFNFTEQGGVEQQNAMTQERLRSTPPPPTPQTPFQAEFWTQANLHKLELHKTQGDKLLPDALVKKHMFGPSLRCMTDFSKPTHAQGGVMEWCHRPNTAELCDKLSSTFAHLRAPGDGDEGESRDAEREGKRAAWGTACALLTKRCVKKGQKVGQRYVTQMDLMHFPALRDLGSCAVVGNSKQLLNSHRGPEISAHDTVIRVGYTINGQQSAPPTKGFEKSVGNRTDVTVILPGYDFQTKYNNKKEAQQYANYKTKYFVKYGYQPVLEWHKRDRQTLYVSDKGMEQMGKFNYAVMDALSATASPGFDPVDELGMHPAELAALRSRSNAKRVAIPEVKAAALFHMSDLCRTVDVYGVPHSVTSAPDTSDGVIRDRVRFDSNNKRTSPFYWGKGLMKNGALLGYRMPDVTVSTLLMNAAMMGGHACTYQDGVPEVDNRRGDGKKGRRRRL